MAVRRHEIGEHGASERRDSKWQAEPDRHGSPSAILDLHFAVIGIFGVCGLLGWDGLRLISARAHIHDSPRKHWMAGEISILGFSPSRASPRGPEIVSTMFLPSVWSGGKDFGGTIDSVGVFGDCWKDELERFARREGL
jgi:hypothetical protein